MDNISKQYKSFVGYESDEFNPILDAMFHTKKEDGRRFLNLMNNIVNDNLYIQKTDNDINLQIIHIPACEPWARELFLMFLIQKLALFHDDSTIKRFKEEMSMSIYNNDNKQVKKLQARNHYFRNICNEFKDNEIPVGKGSKNLIICKETDLMTFKVDKNPWISSYYIDANNIANNHYNLCAEAETDAFFLENIIKKGNQSLSIENVFIFHVNNSVSRSYCLNQLKRLNQYDIGIKNCLVLSFSEKPFRLNETIESIKKRYISIYCQKAINKYNDFQNFVTFTHEESEYLFYRESRLQRKIIDSPDRCFFANEIETFIDNAEHNIRVRNQLSLCWCDKLQRQFSTLIANKTPDFAHEMCNGYYSLLRQVWQADIIPTIKNFCQGSNSIAFIVERDTPTDIKKSIKSLFQEANRDIKFCKFENLKYQKINGRYINSISADKIVILSYKSPNGIPSIYPNSFDALYLNKEQQLLLIINTLTHISLYEWDCFWYNKKFNEVLYSKFREDILDWKYLSFNRPQSSSPKDFIDEDEDDTSHRAYHSEKCKIHFKNGIKDKEISLSEDVIYKLNDVCSIAEINDILELREVSIQLLEEIAEKVKILVTNAINENNNAEKIIRTDPKYNLTEEEIYSTVELWKILLKRKVDKYGAKKVYEEVFAATPEKERISLNSFSQWHSLSSTTILPRSKKDQKSVLSHLSFEVGSAYHRIICTKKLSNINGSRKMNLLIDNLIKNLLFVDIEKNEFTNFQYEFSDLLFLIKVNSHRDLMILKELLLQEINLNPVERFDYDKN